MPDSTRRSFLRGSAAAAALVPEAGAGAAAAREAGERVSLNGTWEFRLDAGERWREVTVPHTWQVEPASAEYMGVAWYRREFEAPAGWSGMAVRIEFEAVFHSATVWVNDQPAGEHLRKGYTAFRLDISRLLRYGATNRIQVRVDNSFDDRMLPRGRSSDWAHDGGIYRPVRLLVTPKVFVERVEIDATPGAAADPARIEAALVVRNAGERDWQGLAACRAIEQATGRAVLQWQAAGPVRVGAGASERVQMPAASLSHPKLWHFDHPHLYTLEARVEGQGTGHRLEETFGIRSFEVRGEGFYLNGERVFLMGAERMAGSHPQYGMAEPEEWIRHDHDDLKELNCVFTRVHWQQDRRVLDYCDRHGILIQTEVPCWGSRTFEGMSGAPSAAILENGMEQLREMIERDRNHPCVFAWGLCNEIGGQNPAAYEFARRMYEEARRLDARRPRTYASHSLQKTPERDVSGLMDFISWNEYYGSWQKGTEEDVRDNLERIHRAFPGKPIVVSEYGYCACTADRPEGDGRRVEVLQGHNRVFREAPYVGGLIFFCYNDYRTHIGDKGVGVCRQRVHGVVDVYGARKPSFEELRRQASPVEALEVRAAADGLKARVVARKQVPAHRLSGYRLRWVVYGHGDIPLEQHEAALAEMAPGDEARVDVRFQEKLPVRVRLDVVRPTGFSTCTAWWRP